VLLRKAEKMLSLRDVVFRIESNKGICNDIEQIVEYMTDRIGRVKLSVFGVRTFLNCRGYHEDQIF